MTIIKKADKEGDMLNDFVSMVVPMALVVGLTYFYALAIEKKREREMEQSENIKQGFQKISLE